MSTKPCCCDDDATLKQSMRVPGVRVGIAAEKIYAGDCVAINDEGEMVNFKPSPVLPPRSKIYKAMETGCAFLVGFLAVATVALLIYHAMRTAGTP